MIYALIVLIGYLLGSFPTAYLIVRWRANLDIRKEGTGNVGGLNSYEVTKSKVVGLSVLIVDLVKGALAVTLVRYIFGDSFENLALAVLGAVAGHNYSVWIGFKGGRGLATATGGMLLVNPLVVAAWIALWLVVFVLVRNVHWGNIVATVVTPFLLILIPRDWLFTLARVPRPEVTEFFVFCFVLCGVVFIKHIKPLVSLLR